MQRVVADGARRILVVEDEPDLRAAMVELFLDAGHACVGVQDMVEARAVLRSSRFDLVVLDLHLRGGSSEDLLAELRRGNAPVVVTSADTTERARGAAKRWAVPFVTKPFELDDLLRTVEESMPDGGA